MTIAGKVAPLFPCAVLIAETLLMLGCASTPQTTELLATCNAAERSVELTEVPFLPQTAYQCGPTALATVLAWSAAAVTPDVLASQVYLPERLPHTAKESAYVLAVLSLERLPRWHHVAVAYDSALSRWPDNLLARMGLGNSRYALGDMPGAEAAYRRATRDHPNAVVAFNNLAHVLADQGRLREAEETARQAVRLGGPMLEQYEDTLDQILARSRRALSG